ncbi:DNA repair protein XRCC2 homolog [Scaptodrosophila lebanonensis]|uniref:DNA repair protein XRCC2 homolog n=1 Tax=Drosophila lebanonensis TaxID=7225 RepID=A0A6J2TQ57_DROLE|nr:DNA repair protein XRCC2 homolog [Scaptodrosophila lebanonensis]
MLGMGRVNRVQKLSEFVLQQRGEKRPRISGLSPRIFQEGPAAKALVEISGKTDTGKSFLLMELMARCALPSSFDGKGCDVILLNLSHKLSGPLFKRRFLDMMKETATDHLHSADELNKAANECLKAIKILNCYSSEELELALVMLDHLLAENEGVALIAVDTLCEFYWLDVREKRMRKHSYYMQWLSRLSQICNKHNVCCMYTLDQSFAEQKATTGTQLAIQIKVDHKIQLKLLPDNQRTLNDQPIVIDDDGVNFLDVS